jgi:serine/threonine protein kinase
LKFLLPKLAQDPVRRERFFAEVRITRQLSHPNICLVYEIQEIGGRYFLSMEFIDGEDLASLIKRIGYLSDEKALDIARRLAAGLAAKEAFAYVHGKKDESVITAPTALVVAFIGKNLAEEMRKDADMEFLPLK